MLYLNRDAILQLLDYDLLIESIEKAYRIQALGTYIMPDRIHVNENDNTMLYMPCITKESFGTKLVTVFPQNRSVQLPVVDGLMVLNNHDTGQVKCLLNGQIMTALRTGAVGGAAVKRFASNKKTIGIIGCGIQGYYQALFADHLNHFDKIYVFDHYHYNEQFKVFGDRLEIAQSADFLVEHSDIIITTTTSETPVFKTNQIKGKLFIGIGSYKPNMREYSDTFVQTVDAIYVDTPFAKKETGDLKIPLDKDLISRDKIHAFYDENIFETIFFKSVGMALFDVLVAETLYKMALSKNIGSELEV